MHTDRPIKIIRAHDPVFVPFALAQIDPYLTSRDPAKLPALAPSAQPTWFTFRRLTRRQLREFVERASSDNEKLDRAFAAGVIAVEGPGAPGGAGKWVPTGVGDPGHLHMQDAELDLFAPLDLTDVGQWVYAMSCSPLGCFPHLRALPMSLRVLDGFDPPSAAPSPTDAAPSNSPPREG